MLVDANTLLYMYIDCVWECLPTSPTSQNIYQILYKHFLKVVGIGKIYIFYFIFSVNLHPFTTHFSYTLNKYSYLHIIHYKNKKVFFCMSFIYSSLFRPIEAKIYKSFCKELIFPWKGYGS